MEDGSDHEDLGEPLRLVRERISDQVFMHLYVRVLYVIEVVGDLKDSSCRDLKTDTLSLLSKSMAFRSAFRKLIVSEDGSACKSYIAPNIRKCPPTSVKHETSSYTSITRLTQWYTRVQ